MKIIKAFQSLCLLLSGSMFISCIEDQTLIIDREPEISTSVTVKQNCNVPVGEYILLKIDNPNDSIEYVWVSENSDIASCKKDTIFGHRIGTTKVLNANATDIKYEIIVNVIK